MAYATVTLTGTYHFPDGSPAVGTIEIIPSERMILDDAGNVVISGRIKARLDDQGKFSVDLPATDDPALTPTGFGYTVAARLHHTHLDAVSFQLPAATPVVDITDVTQVDPSTFEPDANYVTNADLTALDSRVTTLEEAPAVTSYNDLTDKPTIPATAEDVGALPADEADTTVAALAQDPASATGAALSATFARNKIIDANHPSTGIKADGVTDDSVAWNALIASAPAGSVITWTGRSILHDPIVWKTKVSLVGQGWGRSVLATENTDGTYYFPAISYVPFDGASITTPLEDCTFRDFEVDGSGLAGTSAHVSGKAIFAQYLRRCQFLNLYLHDTVGTALGTDFMPECLIDGVLVERGGRNWDGATLGHAGIGIGVGAWEHEPVIITNCTTIDCGNWGIFVEWQEDHPYHSRGARIVNNVVRGTTGKGIGDRGAGETLIMGNHITESDGDGIQIQYGALGTQVVNNHIYDNGGNGVQILENVGSGIMVAGNRIGRNGRRGLYFDGHAGNYTDHAFIDNESHDNGYQGILVDTVINGAGLWRNSVIRGNICYNNGQAGTEADGIKVEADMTGVLISGNRCYDSQTTKTQTVGLRVTGSSSYEFIDCAIEDNHLTGNASAALVPGGVVLTRTEFRGNKGYNPVGTDSPVMGASPYTHTAGATDETLYVMGGTFSTITVGGVTVYNAGANAGTITLPLSAGQVAVFTYSVAPVAFKRTRH